MKKVSFLVALSALLIGQMVLGQETEKGRIIAGSADDFMLVEHHRITGSNKAIGKEIARIAKCLGLEIRPSADSFRNKLQYKYIQNSYPAHFDRMQGIAEEYGIDISKNKLDISSLPYIPSKPFCSVVFYPGELTQNGHDILSRNLDMPIDNSTIHEKRNLHVCSRPIVFEVYPDSGYASIYICILDILGGVVEGMNSAGLSVAALGIDKYRMVPSREVGLDEMLIQRYLLDNCRDVTEAKESLLMLKRYYKVFPLHYIIADNQGNSFIFESSRCGNKTYHIDGDGVQCITNHLLHEIGNENAPKESVDRLNTLHSLTEGKKNFHIDSIKDINSKVSAWMPNRKPEYESSRTLWHSVYNLDTKTVSVKFYLGETIDPNDAGKVITRYSEYIDFILSRDLADSNQN